MSTLSSMNSRERGDTFMQIVNQLCGLSTCRPLPSKGQTTLRIIPEISPEDGTVRPMFLNRGAAGEVWSSMQIENVSVNVGLNEKFTVINRPSDKPALSQLNSPFSGAFVSLRGKQKKKVYPTKEYGDRVEALFQGAVRQGQNFPSGQPLQQGKDMVFLQAVVLQLNGDTLMRPATKQLVILSSQTGKSLQEILAQAHKDKLDLFNPATGRALVLKPMKIPTNDIPIYTVELGAVAPLPEEACRKLWVPWEKVFVRYTYDELMLKLISAIGDDMAASVFPTDVARLLKMQGAPAIAATAHSTPAAVQAQAPVAAASSSQRAAAVSTPVSAPAASAPVMKLDIDADAPATQLEGGPSQSGGSPAAVRPQTTEELEKQFEQMMRDDPTLGPPP